MASFSNNLLSLWQHRFRSHLLLISFTNTKSILGDSLMRLSKTLNWNQSNLIQ
ncbi:hypothetical protein HanXRQr2_Chr16g0747391 [Helianthus annuus]|uniref:Uncharacterized protein n=1 Tax=Helianthus annuus TaxID=4232 RepID=A0A251RNX6_HELAN|nr:hypothetical protein HanXRQr2_Chr16g0747391 [Helianthus annuus]KAJ0821138.1 hypothetical protein HanPSC8_Chr16g0716501 [Helianthus annuus]